DKSAVPWRLQREARAVRAWDYERYRQDQPRFAPNMRQLPRAYFDGITAAAFKQKHKVVSRRLRRLARRFPEADDRSEWLLRAAYADAISGQSARAKEISVEIANSAANPLVR